MAEVWDAERVIDPAQARSLLATVDAGLAHASVEPFGSGFDNTAYLVGGRWVVRFPRRQQAVALLEQECAVLPLLRGLPLAVPDPVLRGGPQGDYPWPWAGYRLLRGRPATEEPVGAVGAAALGGFLRALHLVRLDVPVRGDTQRRGDVAVRRERHGGLPAQLAAEGLLTSAGADALRAALGRARAATVPPVLVHGDLYARHVLVDRGRPCAVIDWGDVHLGDPAQDLAAAWLVLAGEGLDAFASAYGEVDGATLDRARFFAAWHCALVLRYAAARGDASLGAAARRALGSLGVP